MNISIPYVAIAILALAIIAALAVLTGRLRRETRLSRLAAFAFIFVVAGILFSDNRLVGYGLMGVGVLLAVVDIVLRFRRA